MNALLIIDPQNDFCNPGDKDGKNKGTLYVEGAEEDMNRLSNWITINRQELDFIGITLDNHHVNDIAHAEYWTDKEGNQPEPFTQITLKDVSEKKWLPLFEPQKTAKYLKDLELQGEYPHLIWPTHCLIGSEGAAIYQPVMVSLEDWAKLGTFYVVVQKGEYPFTEHFGAFKAQITDTSVPETQLNMRFMEALNKYDTVYLSGEAKSHCVANSLKQILDELPKLAKKIIILEDTMSNVTGFETLAEPIYKRAKEMGVKFSNTDDEIEA